MPAPTAPDGKRLYEIPAGRLAPGDTIYIEGQKYGEVRAITVPAHPDEPVNDGNYWITYDVVLVTFENRSPTSPADAPWSVVRLPYELVTATLASNLKVGRTALDLPIKRAVS